MIIALTIAALLALWIAAWAIKSMMVGIASPRRQLELDISTIDDERTRYDLLKEERDELYRDLQDEKLKSDKLYRDLQDELSHGRDLNLVINRLTNTGGS